MLASLADLYLEARVGNLENNGLFFYLTQIGIIMDIKVKNSVAAFGAVAMLLLSGNVLADDDSSNTGYYAELPSSQAATIPAGVVGNPGPAVTIVEKTVKPGKYLITAQIFGQSYGPNSGAVCYFTGGAAEFGYRTLNTSSDWTILKTTNAVMLGKYITTLTGTKVTVSCVRGYTFENSSQFYGTMLLVPVKNLN
jgi:hypothetical protein